MEPVNYIQVQTKVHNGRGAYYVMIANYNDHHYSVDITSSTYASIKEGILPELYYSSKFDTLFSQWKIKRTFRLFLLFATGFLIVLVSLFLEKSNLKMIGCSVFIERGVIRTTCGDFLSRSRWFECSGNSVALWAAYHLLWFSTTLLNLTNYSFLVNRLLPHPHHGSTSLNF
jgi:hypothetical protein